MCVCVCVCVRERERGGGRERERRIIIIINCRVVTGSCTDYGDVTKRVGRYKVLDYGCSHGVNGSRNGSVADYFCW